MASVWANADGLNVMFGSEQGKERSRGGEVLSTDGTHTLVVPLVATDLVGFDADADNDGTLDSFSGMQASIPAGSLITEAKIVVTTAFAAPGTAGAAVMDIGLYKMGGTAIDADGIDAGIIESALEAGDAISCDGALVGATTGADVGYIKATGTSGNVPTAGKAKLVLKYITK